MTENDSKKILYISYTGILEPLGESQVYRYLEKLAKSHDITLITFEKPSDLEETDRLESMKEEVTKAGIEWHPLRYHHSPSVPATIWDLGRGSVACIRALRRNDIDIVHTRSYVASVLGLLCKRVFGTAFVFDMRGFWADERVDGGLWEDNSRLYRAAKWFEAQFLERADVVVSLTESGIDAIRDFDHVNTSNTRFEMIPTCVDLELFTPDPGRRRDEFVLGYVGSVGTWYLFDDVLDCYELLRAKRPNATLAVLNRGDHELILRKLEEHGIERSAISLKSVRHDEVPREMNRMDAGIFFYKPTFSKKGTSPTKMGEFLSCGIPCLSNVGVGDVERILEENDVGVVLESFDTEAKQRAVERLLELSGSPSTASRCREVAESYYSLETGVRKYDEIYRTIDRDE